jgi:hypothetical protein
MSLAAATVAAMKDVFENINTPDPEPRRPAPEPDDGSLERLLRRDLDAWIEAKAAVEKARRA